MISEAKSDYVYQKDTNTDVMSHTESNTKTFSCQRHIEMTQNMPRPF